MGSFFSVFIAELGDKTQLATILFSTDQQLNKWSVFAASSLAFVLSSLFAVLIGSQLSQWINPRIAKLVAGIGFIGIGVVTLWSTARIELKPYKINILTICPGFVNTDKNKRDGIPKPFSMSEEQAAQHILKALELEIQEYLFPISLKIGIMLERLLPQFIVNKVLSKVIPSEY